MEKLVLVILGLAGFIWKLLGDKKQLQNEITTKEAQHENEKTKEIINNQSNAATNAVSEYERIRDAYLQGSDSSVRQGDTGENKGS